MGSTAHEDSPVFFYPHNRPPGAIPEAEFLKACTRCFDCVRACPYNAIGFLTRSAGDAAGTPAMDPSSRACHLCPDMPCITSCTHGALKPIAVEDIKLGLVKIESRFCTPEGGVFCGKCVEACPKGAITLKGGTGEPIVDEELCAGCGLCLSDCHAPGKPMAVESAAFPMLTRYEK